MNPRALRHLLRMQFEINCLSSVAIEYPALRDHPLLVATRAESYRPGDGLADGAVPAPTSNQEGEPK